MARIRGGIIKPINNSNSIQSINNLYVSGNIGIGTSGPSAPLEVKGFAKYTQVNGNNFVEIGQDPNAKIELKGGTPFIDFSTDTTTDYQSRIQQTATDTLSIISSKSIISGNLGIGIIPSTKLHIYGKQYIETPGPDSTGCLEVRGVNVGSMNYNLIVGGHGGTTTFTVGANGSINASGDIFTTANIGCAGIYCNLVQSSRYSSCYDNRVIRPSALSPYSVAFGFGSWGNNDDGVSWADTMHFNTYSDGSGGNQSLLMIRKSSGMGLRIWQGGFGSTSPYSTALDASLVAPSDIRLKENIEPLKNSLSNILQLQGITYNWKKEYDNLTNNEASSKVEIGFIAQDVENIIPEVVSKNKAVFKGIDNVLTIQYEKLVPVLVEAIKEQQNKINELENKLNNLYNLLTKNGIINSNI